MTAYFSNIKIASNPTAGECLSVGLLAFSHGRFWLQFSDHKLKVAKRLVQNEANVDLTKREIEHKVSELNRQITKEKDRLFEFASEFTSEYIAYVSRYSNNMVQFGAPISLKDNLTMEKFDKLFALMVEKKSAEDSKELRNDEINFHKRVERLLLRPVSKRANTKIQLKERLRLVFNFELDCVAQNGSVILAQSIPFLQSPNTISKHIERTEIVFSRIEREFAEGKRTSKYVIADRPNDSNHEMMKLWEGLVPLRCTVIDSKSANTVAILIKKSKANKLFDETR